MFTVEQSAGRAANYLWTEERLFELLGGWVDSVAEPAIAVMLAEHSHHHAWHAQLWRERIPELAHINPDRIGLAPNREWVELFDALASPGDEPSIERLVAVYRVLVPHLVAAYSFHLDHTAPVTDANTIRALKLVLRDDLDHWRQGELHLQELVTSADQVRVAALRQGHVQELMVAAGGVCGPGTFST